jgi:GT2 family glycosyltransferase
VRLSIVIVNWNLRDDLRECLASLRQQSHGDLEIVVVDNGSTDGSADMVAREFPHCRLLRQIENLGFAEGCNRGIDASTSEWVAMLNNDTVADAAWAHGLVDAAETAPPDCGMLQSLLLFKDRPDTINSTGLELTRRGGGRDRDVNRPRAAAVQAPEDLFCVTAGAAAYRRTMLKAIRLSSGYFDRHHFMYFEDLDLGWRARIAGWQARYVPRSIVFHKWHASTDRHGASWLTVMSGINRIRTLVKNASPVLLARTLPFSIAWAGEVMRHGGVAGLRRLAEAVRQSAALRREVTAKATVDRRRIERRWIVARS